MFAKRILILAAHPDDEVVACAAAIGRARKLGANVFTLYLTNGCIEPESLWPWQRKSYGFFVARRRAEGELAAHFLGVTPVGWSPRPSRHLWRHLPDVYAEVRRAAETHAIDQIWVPAYEGGHADHDALNAVGQKLAKSASVLEFAEYNFFNDETCAQKFPSPNGTEETLSLTFEEQDQKKRALKIYDSEQGNLGYIGVKRECYRPIAAYDYAIPPHAGTLWYTRFHWVPFPHPRIDFSKPKAVSKAIIAFLESA